MEALIVIDMQKGIFDKRIKVYESDLLIKSINEMIDLCHQTHKTVVFLRYTGEIVLQKNTENWELINELHLSHGDMVIDKYGSDAFKAPQFLEFIQTRGINHVYVTGVFSHGCVQSTVMGALQHKLNVSLIEDAHSNLAQNAQNVINSVNMRMARLGVNLISTEGFLKLKEV